MQQWLQWLGFRRLQITTENVSSTTGLKEDDAKWILMVERVIVEIHKRLENNNEGDPDQAEMQILKRLLQNKQISARILERCFGSRDWTPFADELEKLLPSSYYWKMKNFFTKPKRDHSIYGLVKTVRGKMAHFPRGAHTLSVAFMFRFPMLINMLTNLLALALKEDDLLIIAKEIVKPKSFDCKSLCNIPCLAEFLKSDCKLDMEEIISFLDMLSLD